VDDKAA